MSYITISCSNSSTAIRNFYCSRKIAFDIQQKPKTNSYICEFEFATVLHYICGRFSLGLSKYNYGLIAFSFH